MAGVRSGRFLRERGIEGVRCSCLIRSLPTIWHMESTKQVPAVARAAIALLEQCAGFVESIPESVYTSDATTIRGGTIGKHVRHAIDHFAAALGGASGAAPIDYDNRARNVPMETEQASAIAMIRAMQAQIGDLDEAALSRAVRIRVMLASDGSEAVLPSTLAREIAFATHHAIHHNAMMKTIAAEFGLEVGDQFGKAPSTLNFEASNR